MEIKDVDVLIIGGGPAGKTAAIYTARAGLKPVVLTGLTAPGGALMNTTDVENFPGFPEGIPGPDLMEKQQAQAEKFGAVFEFDEADKVDFSGELKVVETQLGIKYRARAVILALGSLYRQLGCNGEAQFAGHGVSYCATCDGFFFKGKDLVVVGGGDTAFEEALYLTRFSPSVTLVHRRAEFRASNIMIERAKANPSIKFETGKVVEDIYGTTTVAGVVLKDVESGELSKLPCEGVFAAIGSDPQTTLVKGAVELDERGYIRLNSASSHTNVPGVFAAGDATDPNYRQAIVAAGAGAKAGIDDERYLEDV